MTQDTNDGAAFPPGPKPGERHATFFDDPLQDHLLRAVITLAGELSVTRERLDSLEAQLAQQGTLDRAALDRRLPDSEQSQAREAARQKLLTRLLEPLVARLSEAGTNDGKDG